MHIFYKAFQDLEFSGETLKGKKTKSEKKPPWIEGKFKLPFIVDLY